MIKLDKVLVQTLELDISSCILELDLEEVQGSKLDFDVIGHYARNDIFDLKVTGQPETEKE